jgi:hypothetical protein
MKSWLFRILGIAERDVQNKIFESIAGMERFIAANGAVLDSLEWQVGRDKRQAPPIEDRILAISEYLGIKFVQKSEQPAKVVAVSTKSGGVTPKKKSAKKS